MMRVGYLPLHGRYTFRIYSDEYILVNILKVFALLTVRFTNRLHEKPFRLFSGEQL